MIRLTLALITLALLAACGADGLPTPPSKAHTSGISLSGEAGIGVSGTL